MSASLFSYEICKNLHNTAMNYFEEQFQLFLYSQFQKKCFYEERRQEKTLR